MDGQASWSCDRDYIYSLKTNTFQMIKIWIENMNVKVIGWEGNLVVKLKPRNASTASESIFF